MIEVFLSPLRLGVPVSLTQRRQVAKSSKLFLTRLYFRQLIFELRQILRTVCTPGDPICPPGVACSLQELDGHAHR